jgi:hypothetical protein
MSGEYISSMLAVREAQDIIEDARRPNWREALLQSAILAWYIATLMFVTHHVVQDARAVQGRPPWRRF